MSGTAGPDPDEASDRDRVSDRDRTAAHRDQTAAYRDRAADAEDRAAEDHDRAAETRDALSDQRDLRAEAREQTAAGVDPGAAEDRAGARRDREGGAGDRARSHRDRQSGAGDRADAERDRQTASTDRQLSAEERAVLLVDGLTGVHRREVGLLELEREVARAGRTDQSFVIAFLDVDGLKATNDLGGHAAGDRRLVGAVDAVRGHIRDYDLLVRLGGDEFLCAQTGLTAADTATRFARVNADLAATGSGAVSVGVAALEPGDSLADLIARADAAMYAGRDTTTAIGRDSPTTG